MCDCVQDYVYWADAAHPVGSLYRIRKFRNVSADNNAVRRVAGQLAMLTDVFVHHELRQPQGLTCLPLPCPILFHRML